MNTDQQRTARIERLSRCLEITAKAVEANQIFTPIFERIDAELGVELEGGSSVDRVRAMIKARKLAAA